MCENIKSINEIIKSLAKIPTAAIYEASGTGALDSKIKPLFKEMKICGSAVTVNAYPNDNLTIHKAIYECTLGDILVINVDGFTEAGYWGEVMTLAAKGRGIKGIVINGGVRDVEIIEKLNFPIFCQNICIRGTRKRNFGTINHEIILGGVRIKPKDIIVGDRDGVVVVPLEKAQTILKDATERIKKEKNIVEELKSKTTLEIYSLEKYIPPDKEIRNLNIIEEGE